jgi:putative endonuclease
MPDARRLFGTDVEKYVAAHLEKQGYRILAHQYKTKFGEIDLVCQDGDEVVFVEVKARASNAFGYPEESVHTTKLRKIVRCAQVFLQKRDSNQAWRIDVVAVEMGAHPRLLHLKSIDIPERF